MNNGEGFSQYGIFSISLFSKWCKVIDVCNINIVPVIFLQTCELVMGNQLIWGCHEDDQRFNERKKKDHTSIFDGIFACYFDLYLGCYIVSWFEIKKKNKGKNQLDPFCWILISHYPPFFFSLETRAVNKFTI